MKLPSYYIILFYYTVLYYNSTILYYEGSSKGSCTFFFTNKKKLWKNILKNIQNPKTEYIKNKTYILKKENFPKNLCISLSRLFCLV